MALPSASTTLDRFNIEDFKRTYPVYGHMLGFFITMTITLIYFNNVLQTWPNSEALEAMAISAIEIITKAHIADKCATLETCRLFHELTGFF
jgi:hypothetical protein